jgi:hypothetical protein
LSPPSPACSRSRWRPRRSPDQEANSRPEDAKAVLDEDKSDPNGLDDGVDGKAREEAFPRGHQLARGRSRDGRRRHAAAPLTGSAGDSSGAAVVAKPAGLPLALVLLASGLLGLRRSRPS